MVYVKKAGSVGGDIAVTSVAVAAKGIAEGITLTSGSEVLTIGPRTTTSNTTYSSGAKSFSYSISADTAGAFAYRLVGSGKLTDTDGEQSWLLAIGDINQSGTAAYNGIKLDITETALGDGSTGDGNNLLWLGIASAPKFRVNNKGLVAVKATAGITAHTDSIQGAGPLLVGVNQISVCANAGDAVTLPPAESDTSINVSIINNGAQACDVFPASGDDCGAGADTAVSLAAGANITYTSYDDTTWLALT